MTKTCDNDKFYPTLFKRVKVIGLGAIIIFLIWTFLDQISTMIRYSNTVLHISYYIIPLLTLIWFKFYKTDKSPKIRKGSVDTTDFMDEIFSGFGKFYNACMGTKNKSSGKNRSKDQRIYSRNYKWKPSQCTSKRSVNNTMKKVVASEQRWECGMCHNLLDASYEVDHIIPLYMGGSNNRNNLAALCRNCHGMKTINDRISLYS